MDFNAADVKGPRHGVGPLAACPTCGSGQLLAVAAEDETNFFCEDCGRCWHVEFARVSRVDPMTCPGCPQRARCLARARVDEPGGKRTVPRAPWQ